MSGITTQPIYSYNTATSNTGYVTYDSGLRGEDIDLFLFASLLNALSRLSENYLDDDIPVSEDIDKLVESFRKRIPMSMWQKLRQLDPRKVEEALRNLDAYGRFSL